MKNEQELMMSLLKLNYNNDITLISDFNDEMLEKMLVFATHHSLAPLISNILVNHHLIDKSNLKDTCKQILLNSIFQYQKQNLELIKIRNVFEENQIYFIPLKGSVLRDFYSEPWLRISCDIDILVRPQDLERATNILIKYGYTFVEKGSHDVSFASENNVHLELHYDVIEKEYNIAKVSEVLENIWDYAFPKENCKYEHILTNEMFYFNHIAHMAKHFVHGGCGIRPFLDLWILNQKMEFDNEHKKDLLKKGGILTFADSAEKLVEVWLTKGDYTQTIKDMEIYVFDGGVYGSLENQIAMNQAATGSKFKSLLSKIFLRYDIIKLYYPILQKHKWLLPFFEIRRWCRLMFLKEHRDRSLNHMALNQNISDDSKSRAENLSKYLGI